MALHLHAANAILISELSIVQDLGPNAVWPMLCRNATPERIGFLVDFTGTAVLWKLAVWREFRTNHKRAGRHKNVAAVLRDYALDRMRFRIFHRSFGGRSIW